MQPEHTDNTNAKINEPLVYAADILIQPGEQNVIYIKAHVCTENEITGIMQPFLN